MLPIYYIFFSDPESREYINSLNGIYLVSQYLGHSNEDIALNALTTLFYLFDSTSPTISEDLRLKVQAYEKYSDVRFQNLGKIFSDTYFKSN